VAFAVAGGGLDVAVADLTAAYLFTSASALWQAAIRVLPVSHRDVQASLHRLRPVIDRLGQEAVVRARDPFTSFHPIQEIASMRHRTATVRMFAS
jgi:urease accessory protein UreF